LCGDGLEHLFLARLLNFTRENEFVEYKVGLLKVEDDVEFANLQYVYVDNSP
jgi:hypothetical protein